MKDYSKLSKREAIGLALMMAINRGDHKAAAKFRKDLNDEVSPSTRNMRRLVGVLIALALAFMVMLFAAGFIHADTYSAPGTCYIMARESTRTWRYGTASSQTRQEVRRTIARGRPFGYRQVRGNCTPPVRIS